MSNRRAFPRPVDRAGGPPIIDPGCSGMTLREWYAGMAMQGQLAAGEIQKLSWIGLSENSFAIADEMMKSSEVRKK